MFVPFHSRYRHWMNAFATINIFLTCTIVICSLEFCGPCRRCPNLCEPHRRHSYFVLIIVSVEVSTEQCQCSTSIALPDLRNRIFDTSFCRCFTNGVFFKDSISSCRSLRAYMQDRLIVWDLHMLRKRKPTTEWMGPDSWCCWASCDSSYYWK